MAANNTINNLKRHEEYGAADFKVKENVIHQSVIDKLKNNKPYCDETMCVISVERLA